MYKRQFLPYSIASNTVAALVAGWYAEHARRGDGLHLRTADGLMLLRGGLLLAATSATIGTAGLLHAGMVQPFEAPRAYLLWTLGDLLGITTMAPALTLLFAPTGRRSALWRENVGQREQIVWSVGLLLSFVGSVRCV